MKEVLKKHIIDRLGTNIENLDLVLSLFTPIEVKKNTLLLQEGNICKYVYFIARGSLQVYTYDAEMNETTRDIVIENNWCSELISFSNNTPTTENIRSIEPSYLLAIDSINFQQMLTKVPQFDTVYRQILEASYANSVYRLNTFVSLNGLSRIKWLLNTRPTLFTRFSSKLIASYLGISQETYSRLKAKL